MDLLISGAVAGILGRRRIASLSYYEAGPTLNDPELVPTTWNRKIKNRRSNELRTLKTIRTEGQTEMGVTTEIARKF